MLVLAPSPKHLFAFTTHVWVIEKVRDREGAIASTRGACAPWNKPRYYCGVIDGDGETLSVGSPAPSRSRFCCFFSCFLNSRASDRKGEPVALGDTDEEFDGVNGVVALAVVSCGRACPCSCRSFFCCLSRAFSWFFGSFPALR